MSWIWIGTHHYNLEYLQEYYWHEGMLHLRFSGRSVPDIITDADAALYKDLCKLLRMPPRGVAVNAEV